MTNPTTPMRKRIAVIGAGAAGLAQAKQVLDAFRTHDGVAVELVVFESRTDVGGVWLEDPDAGVYRVNTDPATNTTRIIPAEPGVLPSPIYPGLRTNLPKYIRFGTTVTRVYKCDSREDGQSQPGWVVQSRLNGRDEGGVRSERFHYVSVTSGHYEKASIPQVGGLDKFTGQVMHSRWYRRPEDFIGKNVLVVGSFASGSDIARELASVNLPSSVLPESMTAHKPARLADHQSTSDRELAGKIRVYQSSSQTPNMFTSGLAADMEDDQRPWLRLIEQRPLIDRIETSTTPSTEGREEVAGSSSVVHFTDGSTLTDIDVIIFATGYLYYYPFFKQSDAPWNREECRILDTPIGEADVLGGEREGEGNTGGLQGLGMRHMDELMLFLEDDRSMAFIGLPYQVVPFPLFEIQSHLVSLLWAGKLPHFPKHPTIPQRPSEDIVPPTPPETPRDSTGTTPIAAYSGANGGNPAVVREQRYTEKVRGAYVFGFPYEFLYENYLLSLTAEADGGKDGGWGEVEEFRWYWRQQKELRFQTIGY
ncbi:hypothetical protein QFC22_006380 [Naganishia vaughanmartiniae]|uniref:Uncharacterized protein n=1 Tax=Naganishia vaughanmartiniae TaxID=1424756 RepID=A0ACC2WLX3_9TREE|nr:hypothetical protein QFC22_006380 [Naganishia vaughanmartiniae]